MKRAVVSDAAVNRTVESRAGVDRAGVRRGRLASACAAGALGLAVAALSGCQATGAGATAQATESGAQDASPVASPATSNQAAGSGDAVSQGASTAAGRSTAGPDAAWNGGPWCTGGQVSVQTADEQAGAGHRSLTLLFTNIGKAACELNGYSGAAVANAAGAVILNASRSTAGYMGGGSQNIAPVRVAPGGHASAVIEWVAFPPDGAQPNAQNCPGLAGGKLLITPPNTTRTTTFPVPQDLCQSFAVHPVVPGTTGRATS